MSKFLKVLILIVFVAGAVILLNQTLFSSWAGDCYCWDEDEAIARCIDYCSQNGGCSYVVPKTFSGVCNGSKCYMSTYYRCVDGSRGVINVSMYCSDCIN